MQVRVEENVERGKEIINQTEGQIAMAIDAGIETYNREKFQGASQLIGMPDISKL